MQLPLCLRDFHEEFLVLDWNPAREHLHRVLEVAVKENLSGAIDESCRCGVYDIETAAKRSVFGSGEGGINVPKEHEDVPNAELSWEGNRVVEEGEVPAGPVSGRLDSEFGLGELAIYMRQR
jgi:hypothetical protein